MSPTAWWSGPRRARRESCTGYTPRSRYVTGWIFMSVPSSELTKYAPCLARRPHIVHERDAILAERSARITNDQPGHRARRRSAVLPLSGRVYGALASPRTSRLVAYGSGGGNSHAGPRAVKTRMTVEKVRREGEPLLRGKRARPAFRHLGIASSRRPTTPAWLPPSTSPANAGGGREIACTTRRARQTRGGARQRGIAI